MDPPTLYLGCVFCRSHRECRVLRQLWENVMEVVVKIEKQNTMSNTQEVSRLVICNIWAASISLNNNYEGIVSKSWNKGCHHLTTFPFPGTICAAALLSLKQMQKPEQKKFWEASMCFHPICLPRCGRFFVRGLGLSFFRTHIGRRPESAANRQFIPPPPITSARSTDIAAEVVIVSLVISAPPYSTHD